MQDLAIDFDQALSVATSETEVKPTHDQTAPEAPEPVPSLQPSSAHQQSAPAHASEIIELEVDDRSQGQRSRAASEVDAAPNLASQESQAQSQTAAGPGIIVSSTGSISSWRPNPY